MLVNDTRREALFASPLQPSDAPTPETVDQAVNGTLRKLGARGCTARMAQEFGDHPETAAARMLWVRETARTPVAC